MTREPKPGEMLPAERLAAIADLLATGYRRYCARKVAESSLIGLDQQTESRAQCARLRDGQDRPAAKDPA